MRLGDLGQLYDAVSDNWCGTDVALVSDLLDFIKDSPTIDPETLPIVRELRRQLSKITAERDAAVSEIESIMAYGTHFSDTCQFCKNAQCHVRGGIKQCLPKWRGIQEVQNGEEK